MSLQVWEVDILAELKFKISLDTEAMMREAKEWFEYNVDYFEDEQDFDDCLSEWVGSNIGRFVDYEMVEE